MEFSEKEITFVDILIKQDSSGIWMDLYHKPTNIQRCLLYAASHLKHWFKNIPFVMARRICTIEENNSVKSGHLKELKEAFKT